VKSAKIAGFVSLILMLMPGFARAAETWISCTGTVVTQPIRKDTPAPPPAPSTHIFAYNDETRVLFEYSNERKSLASLPVSRYTPQQIAWSADHLYTTTGVFWNGSLDRATMTVTIKREDSRGAMTWTEKCSPASPMEVVIPEPPKK